MSLVSWSVSPLPTEPFKFWYPLVIIDLVSFTTHAGRARGFPEQGVGKVVGSERLQAEGEVQEIKGKAQTSVGQAKDAVKDTANKTAAYINKKL